MRIRFNSTIKTALIDLAVVFVGILIALQVDNWRESRSYHRSETLYLKRLHEELQAFNSESDSIMAFLKKNYEGVAFVYQSLESGEIEDGKEALFEHGLIYVGHLPTFLINRSAYDEMVYSGMFARLDSEETRRTISQLFGTQESIKEHFSWWREIPLQLENILSPYCEYYTENSPGLGASKMNGLIQDPKRRIRFNFDALTEDPMIKNGFYWAEDTHSDWLRLTSGLIELAIEAEALVSAELESRSI